MSFKTKMQKRVPGINVDEVPIGTYSICVGESQYYLMYIECYMLYLLC